jgi:hypothetical protein
MPELKFRSPIEKGKELWVGLNRLPCPGFIDGTADFEGPIVPRCLEIERDVFRAGEFGDGGECLPKRRVCAGDFVRKVPWGGTRARGKGEDV